jgi:hypothetical protein
MTGELLDGRIVLKAPIMRYADLEHHETRISVPLVSHFVHHIHKFSVEEYILGLGGGHRYHQHLLLRSIDSKENIFERIGLTNKKVN